MKKLRNHDAAFKAIMMLTHPPCASSVPCCFEQNDEWQTSSHYMMGRDLRPDRHRGDRPILSITTKAA